MSPAVTPGTLPGPPAEPTGRAPKTSEWPLSPVGRPAARFVVDVVTP